MIRIALAAALLIGAVGPSVGQNIAEMINGVPQEAPAAPTTAPTLVFPALQGCEITLDALIRGPAEAIIAQLDRRVGLWESVALPTSPSFNHPAQAEFVLGCFQRRIALLATFVPNTRESFAAITGFLRDWGSQIDAFVAGAVPAGADPVAFWSNADAAFRELVDVEAEITAAVQAGVRIRESELAPARGALAEFSRAVEDVRANQTAFNDRDRAFWLKVLAFRAVAVALALDRVQLADLRRDPATAYGLLTDQRPASAERTLAPALVEIVTRMAALRQTRGPLVPGAARDWSTEGNRQRLAEELYLLHATERRLDAWIDGAIAERADRKRLELQLRHLAEVAGGMPERESRSIRDADWSVFLDELRLEAERAKASWETFLQQQRGRLIEAAIALPPR